MTRLFTNSTRLAVASAWFLLSAAFAQAYSQHEWSAASPDHEQTFAFGSERNRSWAEQGRDHHLAVFLHFTNDPYVDSANPRRYDDFTFRFPEVTLGKDGRTFIIMRRTGARCRWRANARICSASMRSSFCLPLFSWLSSLTGI